MVCTLGTRVVRAAALATFVLLTSLSAAAANAQATNQPANASQGSTGTAQVDSADANDAEDEAWPWLAFTAVAAGLLGAGLVLLFVGLDNKGGQETLRKALELGHPTDVLIIGSLASEGGTAQALGAGYPKVEGPKFVAVGAEATFTADIDGKAEDVTWRVEPTEFADVTSAAQPTVKIKAKKVGEFKVYAKSAAGKESDARVVVALPSSKGSTWSVPFVGQGWGSIVIGIILATVVAALGFVRVLGSEAIGTFFGVLAGYAFHRAATETAAKKEKPANGKAESEAAQPG